MIGILILLFIICSVNLFPTFMSFKLMKRIQDKEMTNEKYTDTMLWIYRLTSVISIVLSVVAGISGFGLLWRIV